MARPLLVCSVAAMAALAAMAGAQLRASSDALASVEGDAELRGTLGGAGRGLVRRTWGTGAAWLAGGGALVLAAYGVLRVRPASDVFASRASLAVVELVAFVLGGLAALGAAHLSLVRAAQPDVEADAEAPSPASALERALRAAASPALLSHALSTLAFSASIALAAFVASGVDRAPRVAFAVSAHALGACLGSALVHVGGRVFASGARAGSMERAEADPDARNPAVVFDALSRRLAERTTSASEIVELGSIDLVAATIVAATARLDLHGLELAPLLFPVVARAFGLVGAFVGVMAVKTTDDEPPLHALDRGSAVSAGLSAIGMFAAAWWLLRGAFVGVACASLLGVLAGWGLVRFGRDARGATGAMVMPTLVALALVPASWACGSVIGAHRNGALALAAATLGVLCASAYPLAASSLNSHDASLVAAARGMRVAVRRSIHAATVVVAWVGVFAFVAQARFDGASSRASDFSTVAPIVGVACALGAVVAVVCAVLARRAAAHVALAAREEIERVLADVPVEEGRRVFPIDFHPAHDRSVAHLAADAQLHAASAILLAVGAPIVVGLVARRAFSLGVESIAALCFGATLVPLLFAPLSRALGVADDVEGSVAAAPWLAFAARTVVAVALALAVIYS